MDYAIDYIRHGLAGQTIACVTTTENHPTDFFGSIYGGPVFIDVGWGQIKVDDPERFGNFGQDPKGWLASFYDTCNDDTTNSGDNDR